MPRGIKGYRWIETGYDVWGLESKPRYFLGFVSPTCDPDCWSWHTTEDAFRSQGYATSKIDARKAIEAIVINRTLPRSSPATGGAP